jgi:hypothetical protein
MTPFTNRIIVTIHDKAKSAVRQRRKATGLFIGSWVARGFMGSRVAAVVARLCCLRGGAKKNGNPISFGLLIWGGNIDK